MACTPETLGKHHGVLFSGHHEAIRGPLGGRTFLIAEVTSEALTIVAVGHFCNSELDIWDQL